ncbi:transporter Sec24 [Thraustotheca clavata]|uniref:Transporter Sec24 n=1 Tax=Thraustotheca clavata TaxID=74557 RepID=A0A1W0A091_9STRA|nr:transporter Sec24 [Thraustotheca clavata]
MSHQFSGPPPGNFGSFRPFNPAQAQAGTLKPTAPQFVPPARGFGGPLQGPPAPRSGGQQFNPSLQQPRSAGNAFNPAAQAQQPRSLGSQEPVGKPFGQPSQQFAPQSMPPVQNTAAFNQPPPLQQITPVKPASESLGGMNQAFARMTMETRNGPFGHQQPPRGPPMQQNPPANFQGPPIQQNTPANFQGPPMQQNPPANLQGPPLARASSANFQGHPMHGQGPPLGQNSATNFQGPPMQGPPSQASSTHEKPSQMYNHTPQNHPCGPETPGFQRQHSAPLPSGDFNQENFATPAPVAPGIIQRVTAPPCNPRFMHMTVNAIPHSQDNATKCALPMGLILQPMAKLENDDELPVVNFGMSGVVRCKSCRSYINPYIQWMDNGRRWRCNFCGIANDVPSSYFCHLAPNGARQDINERPELLGSVEIVAPNEYSVRPPIPPAFVFVVDVSAQAVASGMVEVFANTILEQLDNLPGDTRTQFGLITYDSTIHFYNLKAGLKAPQMMVVPDINELFIPIPDELLVNLSKSRDVIESLLEMLPRLHLGTKNPDTALGPAIRAAFRLMSAAGGKMMIFQSSLPTSGQGVLKHREDPRAIGTEKEHNLLNPVDTFYRKNAIEFCRQQVSVDTFLFAPQYTDVASLAPLSKYSGGQLFHYPGFTKAKDGDKFAAELTHSLTRETGWEAIIRLRCTKGVRFTNYYGNAFLRGPDLLAAPCVHTDAAFGIEIELSDTLLTSNTICFQAGVLYTTSKGERRIRVHTIAVPVVKGYMDLFSAVDSDAMCNLVAKSALEMALKTGLHSARNKLQAVASDVARAYRTYGGNMATGYQLQLPASMHSLPLNMVEIDMALMKNIAFRGGNDIGPDERTAVHYALNNMAVTLSRAFIYPRLFSVLDMPHEAGHPVAPDTPGVLCAGQDKIQLPPLVNLSVARFNTEGAFLLDDSLALYLWLGQSVSPRFIWSLFGRDSIEGVDLRELQLAPPQDEMSTRIHNIINAIREERPPFLKLHVLREGAPGEGRFFWKLVEDRASFNGGTYSYAEFLGQVNRSSTASK